MTPIPRPLGKTGFSIAPLVLGTNVFGSTIDEATSFSILDAFVDAGYDAIDTADVYSRWAPGNKGGESEAIIGKWLKRNPSKRDRVHLLTKVGSDMGSGRKDLSKRWIVREVEESLEGVASPISRRARFSNSCRSRRHQRSALCSTR